MKTTHLWFRLLRERMSARAKKLGIQSEQDVFDQV